MGMLIIDVLKLAWHPKVGIIRRDHNMNSRRVYNYYTDSYYY